MAIQSSEIHFYYYRFDALYPQVTHYQTLLSQDEKERASKFHFEADQKRFAIARGKLREILGQYLTCDPTDLKFNYGEYGKPFLDCRASLAMTGTLHFNLAHTKQAFLIGLNLDQPIGVDLEYCDRAIDPHALSKQIMSPLEKKYFESRPIEAHQEAFLRAWVRKEAFVKALGIGLNADLKNLSLTIDDNKSLTFSHDKKNWQVIDLPKRDQHLLAFSVQSEPNKLPKFFTE